MGYGTDGLTFNTLRRGNIKRLPLFKDAKGRTCHVGTGEDWSPAQWLQAVTGELGEYANLRKKVERGDFTLDEKREDLGRELADVVIYLDILAYQLGIDLGSAVMNKWNETSDKVGAPLYLDAEDWHLSPGVRGEGLRPGDPGYEPLTCVNCLGRATKVVNGKSPKSVCDAYPTCVPKSTGIPNYDPHGTGR